MDRFRGVSLLTAIGDVVTDEKRKARPEILIRDLLRYAREVTLLSKSDLPGTLRVSLFLRLFSAFDAFSGHLLFALFERRPESLKGFFDATIVISEILEIGSLAELKRRTLQARVEDLRRKSYIEQFEFLENMFGLKLRKYSRWAEFVECSQRRNLLTHNDGVVNNQYLAICGKEGYAIPESTALGLQLSLDDTYLHAACLLLTDVAVGLTHTLWRKVLPGELEQADVSLHKILYDSLLSEDWEVAEQLGEFAHSQREFASDLNRRITTVNYAIALKFGGNPVRCATVLGEADWTATLDVLRMARSILADDFKEAARIMKVIGPVGELVHEAVYGMWPLFRVFRTSPEFLAAYEKIYGHPFVEHLIESTEKETAAAQHLGGANLRVETSGNEQEHEVVKLADESGSGGAA